MIVDGINVFIGCICNTALCNYDPTVVDLLDQVNQQHISNARAPRLGPSVENAWILPDHKLLAQRWWGRSLPFNKLCSQRRLTTNHRVTCFPRAPNPWLVDLKSMDLRTGPWVRCKPMMCFGSCKCTLVTSGINIASLCRCLHMTCQDDQVLVTTIVSFCSHWAANVLTGCYHAVWCLHRDNVGNPICRPRCGCFVQDDGQV